MTEEELLLLLLLLWIVVVSVVCVKPTFCVKMKNQDGYKAIEDKGERLVFIDYESKRLYTLDIVKFLNSNLSLLRKDKGDDMDTVAKPTELDFVLQGIGSGLVPTVCCAGSFLMCRSHSVFHLINPVTKEWKKVPKTPLTEKSFTWELYGFGLDESTNQYKVVEGKGCTDGFAFSVYSSSTDSWREIEGLYPYKQTRICRKDGVLLNGAVHWLARPEGPLVIVSFNLAEEKVREIQVPPRWRYGTVDVELGVCRDRLCVTAISSKTETYRAFWVMKEYGVLHSWTKMRLPLPYHQLLLSGFYTEYYNLIVVDFKVPFMCDFDGKSGWVLEIGRLGEIGKFGSMGVYVESRKPLIDQELPK